jgi:hypothetical protein
MASFAGQPVREVRKLGANYTLQHRKGKKPLRARTVRDRVRRALRRHRRITALAGSRTFGTVFHTGVAQEALFGVELSLVNPVEVANLRKAVVRAHGVAIMGTSHKVSLLAIPLARDPQWMIVCRTLGAYAREAYNMVVEPHLDHLTTLEFARLFAQPNPLLRPYRTAWKDPIAALHDALRRHNLEWHRVMIWKKGGCEMHLQAGPPALLYRLLKPGARQRQLQEAQFPGAPDGWEAPYLLAVLDSRSTKHALSLRGKKALLAYMSGRYPTRGVLAGWGFRTGTECPRC